MSTKIVVHMRDSKEARALAYELKMYGYYAQPLDYPAVETDAPEKSALIIAGQVKDMFGEKLSAYTDLSKEKEPPLEDLKNALQMIEMEYEINPGPRSILDDVERLLRSAIRKMERR